MSIQAGTKLNPTESADSKAHKSKYAKIISGLGVAGLIGLKLIVGIGSTQHHEVVFHSGPIKAELAAAISSDDWTQVQATFRKCKVEVDDKGIKSWQPYSCEPFIMIHDSITAKAQAVYHGLANETYYGLSESWKERETEFFPVAKDK